MVDVGHNRKEFTNVTCMLSTAVRGNVHNSATTLYVDGADLVSAVKQTAAAFRTSTGFLNEAYLGITALVDGDMSSHLTLQILQSIILRTLKDEAQSHTSSNMPITSECRPCRADHPESSDFSVSTVQASSVNQSSTVMNTLPRRAITSVCQQQFATFTPQIPLQLSAPKTGQIDIGRSEKSTATLQAPEQHTPLSPVQAVLLIPVEISSPSPASKARPSDTRKRQQKPALSRSMSAPFEVSTPQKKANALLQIPIELSLLSPTLENISPDVQKGPQNSTLPLSLPASSEVSSVTLEHYQSVPHTITADVSKNAATDKIEVDNEMFVDVPSCLDLNQVQNNIWSETSKEFLHEKLHPDNKSGENKNSDKLCEIKGSAVHDYPHQLPSTFHDTQDKNSLESFTHSQTSNISQIKEISSVTAEQDSNVKAVGDPVLPVTDELLMTDKSSDSRTEILSIADASNLISVSSDISTTFPGISESMQRTMTPVISSDDVKKPISGNVPGDTATEFSDPSTESATTSEENILGNAPEDVECPVLGHDDSWPKKDSRQPILEVLSGMLNSSITDMAADTDKGLIHSDAAGMANDSSKNNDITCDTNTTDKTHDTGTIGRTNETNESSSGVNKNDIAYGDSQTVSCDFDAPIPVSSEETLWNKSEEISNPTPDEETDPSFC